MPDIPIITPIPWDGAEDTRPKEIPPGLYSDPTDIFKRCPGISYSRLKEIMPPQTPKHLHDKMLHPERYPEDTDAALRGRMLHCLIFEPERFKSEFFETPTDFRRQGPAKKAQWDAWVEEYGIDRIIRTPKQRELLRDIEIIAAELMSREYTRKAFTGGRAEVCMFWRDAETGARCKGRMDYIKFMQDTAVVSDLKSIGRNHDPEEVRKNIGANKYDIQAAFYMDGVYEAVGWEPVYLLIYQRVQAPWFPQEYEIGMEIVGDARRSYRRALSALLECYRTDEWPQYSDKPIRINELTRWERKNREAKE